MTKDLASAIKQGEWIIANPEGLYGEQGDVGIATLRLLIEIAKHMEEE